MGTCDAGPKRAVLRGSAASQPLSGVQHRKEEPSFVIILERKAPLWAWFWVVTNRIIKLRAIYSSHNLLSATAVVVVVVVFSSSVVCNMPTPCFCLRSPTTTLYRKETGLREGKRLVQGTQQVGTCWNPASSLQVQGPGHPACHKLPLLLLPAPPGRERHQP